MDVGPKTTDQGKTLNVMASCLELQRVECLSF